MGGGHFRQVPKRIWMDGHEADGDDGRGAGRKRKPGMVGGRGCSEHCEARESSGDGVGVDDGARHEHGDRTPYGKGSYGAHGMRGHRMGGGHVGEMSSGTWGRREPANDDDCAVTHGKRKPDVVDGFRRAEPVPEVQPSSYWICVDDGAWCKHGGCACYLGVPWWAYGMRGHRMGGGHVGEVFDRTRGSRVTSSCDDGGSQHTKRERGVVGGDSGYEPDASLESSRDRIDVSDGARQGAWIDLLHQQKSTFIHGV